MKKTLVLFTIAALFMGSNTAFASTSTDQLIAQLQQQIALLSAKLTALKQAQTEAASATQSVNDTLVLIGNLSEGMTGDQVALLQATLANDASVYPEGKVTGFYGKLTKEAIKRFQKKNGLTVDGTLNASTVALLNQILSQSSFRQEDDDEDEDEDGDDHGNNNIKKRFCIIGDYDDLKRNGKSNNGKHRGWDKVVLPRCKHIPGKGTGTTTPDRVSPVVSAITVSGVSTTGATVSWSTNENATSKLYVSTVSPVATSAATWTDGALRTAHSASIGSLSVNTTYYFVVEAADAPGNKTLSAQGSFTTGVVASDTTAPVISAITVSGVTASGATVTWSTNENAASKVYVSATSPVATSAAAWTDSVFQSAHSATVGSLSANTAYYFVVEAADAAGNKTLSAQGSFTTAVTPDTTAPIVSGFSVAPTSSTTGTALWTTNEAASSRVYFSTTSPVNTGIASSVFDATLLSSHSVALTGLSASTTYYVIAESRDAATNAGISTEGSFTTLP